MLRAFVFTHADIQFPLRRANVNLVKPWCGDFVDAAYEASDTATVFCVDFHESCHGFLEHEHQNYSRVNARGYIPSQR